MLTPVVPLGHSMQERLLSRRGQQGWNQLFDLLQAEIVARPADTHVNVKLVELFCQDGRFEEAVKHCLAAEKRGLLSQSLGWYTVVLRTLQVSKNTRNAQYSIFPCVFKASVLYPKI